VQRILIMGATSAIAEATARLFAVRGDALFLVARNQRALEAVAEDLRLRGAASVVTAMLDAREFGRHAAMIETAVCSLGGLDQALIAHGTLSDQAACESSTEQLRDDFLSNALSVMSLSLSIAAVFKAQGRGVLAAISSVAADRGRRSNYIYGSAKASVTTFLSGMRQELYAAGVRVVTIKPGFVVTPMTAAFRHGVLWAQPARVARDIVRAMDHGTPVLYTPWFWRPIMLLVRLVPERVFRRLRT
jgi:decaprenylphospho-beta-D-erythro-pentofuranosid-2-ulose 2-reductase